MSFYEGPPFRFVNTPHRHGNFANCVRFSPDGVKFASVGSDGVGVVYDGRTGAPIAELPAGGKLAGGQGQGAGHVGTIYACAWSPDSAKLLTAGADKTCKLWAVPQLDAQGDAARRRLHLPVVRLCPGSRSSRITRSFKPLGTCRWGASSSATSPSPSRSPET